MKLIKRPWVWIGFALLPGLLAIIAGAEETPKVRTFAVRTLAEKSALAKAIHSGGFHRFVASRDKAVELVVGPEAIGDTLIEARIFPADEELQRQLQGLPAQIRGDGIVLGDTLYSKALYSDKIALALRKPGSSWVVVGYEPDSVAALVDRLLWSLSGRSRRGGLDVDYFLWEHPWSNRAGHWRKTETGFAIDPNERDDPAARAALYASMETVERPRVMLRVPVGYGDDPIALSLADQLDDAIRGMTVRLGPARPQPVAIPKTPEPLEILVERDFVDMGRHLARIGETVLNAGRVHLVYHEDDSDAYRHGLARALIRRAGLELPPRLEDGAALWLSGGWYGRPYADWLADLAFGRVLPSAEELLTDDCPSGDCREHRTEVLWPPVSAALVDLMPGATLRDKLEHLASDPGLLSARVSRQLNELEKRLATETPAPAKPSTAQSNTAKPSTAKPSTAQSNTVQLPFQNGVSLAMFNGLEEGYHAPGVNEQLQRLRRLGTNSVSLMPFAGQSKPHEPTLRFFNGGVSSETDVGMIHAARRAREQGVRVLWKPHIWVSHDSWPGDIAMTSEQDWASWWHHYRRFILRHAVLAEQAGSELFSVGVELGKTVGREAEWRHLIRSVRRIYSGQITYSGNWWGDYDQVPFWDELDYVGVDAYFPLTDSPDPDREALQVGARRAVDQLRAAAERFGKPVLLTEVGFAARRGAWISPHEEGGELSEEHQALAYEVLLEALGRPPWLAGVYLWKVFSHPSIEGGQRPDFQFLGRPAERVVRDYFQN